MADDRNPEKDRNPETPDGYFNTPEGRGVVSFLDDDGKEMTYDELQEYWKQKEKRLAKEGRRPNVTYLDEDGRPITREQWLAHLDEDEKRFVARGEPNPSAAPPDPRV